MSRSVAASVVILVVVHLAAALAGFLAPYEPEFQHRDYPWAPPARIAFDGMRLTASAPGLAAAYPILFFHRGPRGWQLFAVDEPGRLFLLGTDGLGRDQFSRLVHGARISLFSGILAAAVAALAGTCLGGAAGFFGGRTDRAIMRLAELFLALPWMYLLLAARAFFPLNSDPRVVFAALLAVLGVIGWARPARLVRGVVLSVKEREYVLAARGFGATPVYLLRRHIVPDAFPAIATYLGLAVPQYVLAETTLSFLGLGFSGSAPSWGSLIAALTSLEALHYWWMAAPAAGLAIVFACYSRVAEALGSLKAGA